MLKTSTVVAPSTRAREAKQRLSTWSLSVALFTLALLPRAGLSVRFYTVDEVYNWFPRSERLLGAVRAGDYLQTIQSGHPGVTTMWCGAIGALLHQLLQSLSLIPGDDPNLQRALMRLPVAVVAAASIAVGYGLMRRLVGARIALGATALWAADPFLIAHARVLHTDSLLTSFMAVSLLAAMVGFRLDEDTDRATRPIRLPALALSGIAGGLALLTKSPAMILPLMIGLIALISGWKAPRLGRRLPIAPLAIWCGISLGVWLALWPAAWVNPVEAAGAMADEVRGNGAEPHAWGNFFLGRPDPAPGPLFYLVAIPFRLTPWTLVGLVCALGLMAIRRRKMGLPLLILALFALLFAGAMSALPKKFDRYVLPIFPTLDILAAVGLVGLIDGIRDRWQFLRRPEARYLWKGFTVAGALGLALNIAAYHPFELAYYNPLLGGGSTAVRTVPVGWGEGLEQVGAYLRSQTDQCDVPLAMEFGVLLQDSICNPIVDLGAAGLPEFQGYAVLYVDQIQRNDEPVVTAALLGNATPVHTVRIHGIDYAYVYQVNRRIARPVAADFGPTLHFKGYDAKSDSVAQENALRLTLQWQASSPVPADTMIFVHLLDEAGGRVGQVDVPLIGEHAPAHIWNQGRVVLWEQLVPVQPGLPPGTYWVGLGVYRAEDGSRLPLQGPVTPGAPSDGEHALVLGPIQIP